MNANILELGEAFLNAFDEKDISKITEMVHPEIRLRSPMNEASNRESYLAVVRRLLANIKGLRIRSKFASGNQAMFTYDIDYNEPIGLVTAAILMTLEGDQIKDLEVFYDARPFEKVSAPPGFKLAA